MLQEKFWDTFFFTQDNHSITPSPPSFDITFFRSSQLLLVSRMCVWKNHGSKWHLLGSDELLWTFPQAQWLSDGHPWGLGSPLGQPVLWCWEYLPREWACVVFLPKQSPGCIAWLHFPACSKDCAQHLTRHVLQGPLNNIMKTGFWKPETSGNCC